MNEPEIKVPKKRGRKPKNFYTEQQDAIENKVITEKKDKSIKLKRGRKPKIKQVEEVKKYESNSIDNEQNINNTIILKLHSDAINNTKNEIIHKDENREKEFLNYTEIDILASPKGYNANETSNFFSNPEMINFNNDNINSFKIKKKNKLVSNDKIENLSVHNVLDEFIVRDSWPISTECYCFWCCHSFSNIPYGIPFKYVNKKFYVYGCFCSLECCVAYNFSSQNNMYDMWENFSLINLLSHKLEYKDFIKSAPPRETLKVFGGYMNIQEFRDYTNNKKIFNILNYPMISSQHQIEEINEQTLNNNRLFVPIDTDKIKKIEQKFKLIRQKPILNSKNTLDHTMKLKIESDNKNT